MKNLFLLGCCWITLSLNAMECDTTMGETKQPVFSSEIVFPEQLKEWAEQYKKQTVANQLKTFFLLKSHKDALSKLLVNTKRTLLSVEEMCDKYQCQWNGIKEELNTEYNEVKDIVTLFEQLLPQVKERNINTEQLRELVVKQLHITNSCITNAKAIHHPIIEAILLQEKNDRHAVVEQTTFISIIRRDSNLDNN